MIVDVVDCQRCGNTRVLGLVIDNPPQVKAIEVCDVCVHYQVQQWFRDEELPFGKGVPGSQFLVPRDTLGKNAGPNHVISAFEAELKAGGVNPCPRCGSTQHYDPEGCPGAQFQRK